MFDRIHQLFRRGVPQRDPGASSVAESLDGVERLARCHPKDRSALARALAARMREAGPRDWREFGACERRPVLEPGAVKVLRSLPPDDAVEMLGLATLSASGFTRAAALAALERLGHPRAVPYVLLRLGDWVAPVRAAALAALRSLLDRGAAELIAHHELVERLRDVERVDLSAAVAEIRARLRTAGSRAAVESGLVAERIGTRLFCFRLLEDELAAHPDLVARARSDRDPTVRAWLAGRIARGELDVAEPVFRALLLDRASCVSTTMIRWLTPTRAAAHRRELMDLAIADARPVRDAARFVLGPAAAAEIAAACRARLDGAPPAEPRPGWVACLGELGDAGDLERVLARLDHPCPRIRAAAVAAAARLAPDGSVPRVVERLADPAGRVRRAASAALERASPELWSERVLTILGSAPESARLAALDLLADRGGWDAIPAMLLASVADSDALRARGWSRLDVWFRRHGARGWIRPAPSCRAAIAALWPRARGREDAPEWAGPSRSLLKRWIDEVLAEGGPSGS